MICRRVPVVGARLGAGACWAAALESARTIATNVASLIVISLFPRHERYANANPVLSAYSPREGHCMKMRTISTLASVALVIGLAVLTSRSLTAETKADILWDRYGVPHIFAADRESMFHAHGWAQMQNQANLLLRLYGESRGRAAEYWGPSNLELDRWVQLNGVPERAQAW